MDASLPLWNEEHPNNRQSRAEVEVWHTRIPASALVEYNLIRKGAEVVGALSFIDERNDQIPRTFVHVDLLTRPHSVTSVVPYALGIVDEAAPRLNSRAMVIWTADYEEEKVSIALQNGYSIIQTAPVTRMALAEFDSAPFAERVRGVAAQGIRLATVAELEQEGIEWVEPLYNASWEMALDMPNPHPPVRTPLEQFRKMLENRAVYQHDLMFVALDGDSLVGYSRIAPMQAMPDVVLTGMSGVVRTHRRRGIVTALKVAGIEAVKSRGFALLQTDNDETNPMYHLNLELGFKPAWRFLSLQKSFG